MGAIGEPTSVDRNPGGSHRGACREATLGYDDRRPPHREQAKPSAEEVGAACSDGLHRARIAPPGSCGVAERSATSSFQAAAHPSADPGHVWICAVPVVET